MGFWMFGFLSVVLAVLKLTVAGYWSWWRVMLPFLAFLDHNAVYLLAGFLCFCWLKHEEDEEEPTDRAGAFEGGVQASGAVILLPVFGQPVATRRRTRLEPADVSPRNGSVPVVIS
jgi:predicted Na+-dependent transporter